MKKAVFLIFLTIAVSSQAQNWKRGLAVVVYHTATIALGAVADGLYDDGYKEWGHALHAVELGAVLAGPFIHKPRGAAEIVSYLISYGFLRFSFFDAFYNWTRGLPMNYIGSTSHYDQFFAQMPPDGRAWWKSCSLVVGIAIPIKSFR